MSSPSSWKQVATWQAKHTMTRTYLFCAALFALLGACAASAQSTMSPQEQALLQQMRQAAKQQGIELTPEMEAKALERMRDMQANVLGLQMAAQQMKQGTSLPQMEAPPAKAATVVQDGPTEGWLGNVLRHREAARKTSFEDSRDGFLADGKPWLDSQGEIEWYGADRQTGDVTYLVRTGPSSFDVRFANVHSQLTPVTVGSVTVTSDRESFTSIDGATLSGESIIPLSTGLIATRGSAFFRYEYGTGTSNFSIPEQYGILPVQRGDVMGTGYLLGVKRAKRTFGDMFLATARKFPTTFGKRDPDFALIDTRSGALVVLPRSEATTDLAWKLRFREGMRNSQHYYNAIDWQQTSIGTIALVFGDDSATLYAVEIPSGRHVTLLKRGMGINEWRSEATADGGLRVEAQLGFKHETIEDVRPAMATAVQ